MTFLKNRFYRWLIKRASGVMSMGTLGDEFFMKFGAKPRYLYRVPCWPDYDGFARVDYIQLERFRRKYGLNQERHYLVFSGRLMRNKRVDLLIDAFVAISAKRPDWDLLIVGDGVLGDELRTRAPESVRSRIVWTGFLNGADLTLAYHAADVLVLPSDWEPWALVVQEAMAAGLVVVSSDVSGAAYDLIKDGQSGRLFPSGNLAELQRALLDVTDAASLDEYKRQSCAALKFWRERSDPVAEIRRALSDVGVLTANVAELTVKSKTTTDEGRLA